MTRRYVLGAVLAAAAWATLAAAPQGAPLRDAHDAWDRGDYPAALTAYLALLETPDGERLLQEIALQTGEWFKTLELTTDGGAPRFSPTGEHFTYEVGRGVARRTRLASTQAPTQTVAELPGFGAAFSPDGGRLAYLKLTPTDEMREIEEAADASAGATRTERLASLAELTERAARITLRDLRNGSEREVEVGTRRKEALAIGAGGSLVFSGADESGVDQLYLAREGRDVVALTAGEPGKTLQERNADGTALLFGHRAPPGRSTSAGAPPAFGVVALPEGTVTAVAGSAPAFSADGGTLVYVVRTGDRSELRAAPTAAPGQGSTLRSGPERLDDPSPSRDGGRVLFQIMAGEDWEIHAIGRDGGQETRVTREIQHDVTPRFLDDRRALGLVGEARHRRSYIYDLATARQTRVFHNNTVRTIAPEYEWVPNAQGTRLLVVAERDGDTVSPERGVYLVDLSRTVTREEVRARLRASLAAEESLRASGRRMFAPIADQVRRVVAAASAGRVYEYEKALFGFDSKHVSRPGNRLASTYLHDTYASFGYRPEYQWLGGRDVFDGQTANVLAALEGTDNPELVYVVSSHYDSVAAGPGADDNSSGTAALLEAARILAKHPQPATIVFASFTGEESGLLGSREYVRRAVADNVRIVGALNNDMIGWANDQRLDNTVRYSNPGIRDVQHAAAIQFTRLITYDARYYKGTDAHAYYDAYGDIVGGIGSYPVLGNPHYHQPHDTLETINHELVTEVARTTAATLMLLASSPSQLNDLRIERDDRGTVTVSWTPSPEKGVTGYIVSVGDPEAAGSTRIRVRGASATVQAAAGTLVAVKAVNRRGLEGWDWARIRVDGE